MFDGYGSRVAGRGGDGSSSIIIDFRQDSRIATSFLPPKSGVFVKKGILKPTPDDVYSRSDSPISCSRTSRTTSLSVACKIRAELIGLTWEAASFIFACDRVLLWSNREV